jgi:hypothetical protein
MNKFNLIGLVAFLILGCTVTNIKIHESQGIIHLGSTMKMDKAKFGFLYFPEEGSMLFCESKSIPLKKGTFYGWWIHLITDKDKVTWKEVLILPESPRIWGYKRANWGYRHGTEFNEQGKEAITEKTVSPTKEGWIGHGWFVATGDLPGTYVMKIYIEGFLARTFSFELK